MSDNFATSGRTNDAGKDLRVSVCRNQWVERAPSNATKCAAAMESVTVTSASPISRAQTEDRRTLVIKIPRTSNLRPVLVHTSLLLLSLTAATTGYGQPGAGKESMPQVELAANSACGSADQLRNEILRLAPTVSKRDLRVMLSIVERNGVYLAELLLSGTLEGRRELRAETCESAIHAAALIVALAVDPNAALLSQPQATEPLATEPRATEPQVTKSQTASDELQDLELQQDSEDKLWQFFVTAGAMLRGVSLPRHAIGPNLGFGVRTEKLSLRLGAAHFFDAELETMGAESVTGRFLSTLVALDACGVPWSWSVEVALCSGVQLERLRGTTTEEQFSSPQIVWLPSAVAGLRLRYPSEGSFSIVAESSAEFQLRRPLPSFAVMNAGPLYDVQTVGIRSGITLRWEP